MNLLGMVLPGPTILWRIGAYAIAALALVAFGWFKGSEHWHTVLIDERAHALTEGQRIAAVRKEVTVKVETKYLPQLVKQQVITQTIVQEVPVYVSASDPDLSPGFRELHDAAAAGRLPDPARKRDGTPVAAQDAAGTVTENYGICRRDQLKLQELQEWITEQGKVR
jgi:hypothetical protein